MKTITKIALIGLTTLPLLAGAQVSPIPPSSNPLVQVLGFLNTLTTWMLAFLLVVAGIFIIVAAYYYLTASGDQAQVAKAKSMIIYALVAIAIGLLSKVIVALASYFVGGPTTF